MLLKIYKKIRRFILAIVIVGIFLPVITDVILKVLYNHKNELIQNLNTYYLHFVLLIILTITIMFISERWFSTHEKKERFNSLWELHVKVNDIQIKEDLNIPDPHNFYIKRDSDLEIVKCLRNGEDILITGRPKLGKTRSVFEAIKDLTDFYLIIPYPSFKEPSSNENLKSFFNNMSHILSQRKYIVLFDDINIDVWEDEIYKAIKVLKNKCAKMVVIATCRTGDELSYFNETLKNKFDSILIINLIDISEQQWYKISSNVGKKIGKYDGTPGSVFILDPKEMKTRYDRLEEKQKMILMTVKLLYSTGHKKYPNLYFRPRVYLLYNLLFRKKKVNDIFFDQNISRLVDQSLLLEEVIEKKKYIKIYDPYIDGFVQYSPTNKDYSIMKKFFEDENDSGALYILGKYLIKTIKFQLAKECFESILNIYPHHIGAMIQLGYINTELGKIQNNIADAIKLYKEAISYYETALVIKPDDKTAHHNLGFTFVSLGEMDKSKQKELCEKALREYSKAIELDNEFVTAYRNRANLYFSFGEMDKAEKGFLKSLELDENSLITYNSIAYFYSYRGEGESAKHYYEKALNLDPNHTQSLTNYGILLVKLKEEEKAIKHLKKSILIEPNSVVALVELGKILTKYKYDDTTNEEGLKYLKKAFNIDKNYSDIQIALSAAFGNMERYEESNSILKSLLESKPDDIDLLNKYGTLLSRWGEYNIENNNEKLGKQLFFLSESKLKKALSIDPKNEDSLLGYAVLLEKLTKYNEAEEYYKKIIYEINPKNQTAINTYYVFLKNTKDLKYAEEFSKIFKISPKALNRDKKKKN